MMKNQNIMLVCCNGIISIISHLHKNISDVYKRQGFIFLSPLYQRYGIRGFCIQDNHAVSFDSIAYGVLVLLLSAGGCTSFELFRRWVVSDKKILELEKATKQAELQQLKKQINPHFLFNMLNNANILVKDAPDEASQILEKLDNLLRYQLNAVSYTHLDVYKRQPMT